VRTRLARAVLFGSLLLASSGLSFGQENSRQETQKQQTPEENSQMTWKLINTGLFAIVLGYMLWKSAPRFFNARSADIQKAIKDATGLKMNADLRYSEADRKMAMLPDELKRLRAQAAVEMEREHARIEKETEQEIQHIRRKLQFESDALRNESRDQIRVRTAQLAFEVAEQRLRQGALSERGSDIDAFIHLVEKGKN
jgi:F0F1-type ATP synthase membrane subunit b/b'